MILGLFLGLFPVVLDMGTNFSFSAKLNAQGNANQSLVFEYEHPLVGNIETNTGTYFASQTYISLPGIILGMRGFVEIMKEILRIPCKSNKKEEKSKIFKISFLFLSFVQSMLVLSIVMVLIFGLFLINMALVQEPSFYIGIFCSLFIICVKLAAVFCHGPKMKNYGT